jgi:uncharacterized membrane protein
MNKKIMFITLLLSLIPLQALAGSIRFFDYEGTICRLTDEGMTGLFILIMLISSILYFVRNLIRFFD